MSTPFRNDVDALKTRLASLDDELTALRSRTRDYETLRERLAHTEREHAELRREIDARQSRRAVPLLDSVRIASPCNASWDDMVGDERTRFCGQCQKSVHNLSELTREEAETFLHHVTDSVCVRIYQRTDGTVLTTDCPVGHRKKRVKRLFLATVGAGLAAAAGAVAFWAYEETVMQGEIAVAQGGISGVEPPVAPAPPPVSPTGEATSPRTFATPPGDRDRAAAGTMPLPTHQVASPDGAPAPKKRAVDPRR